MAINALTPPKVQFFDDNGDPLALGKVYTYEPGTTTPKASYSDSNGATANTNPVILNARGEASIYLDGSYKIVVKTSADVTVYTVDNFTGAAGFPVNDTISIVQDPTDNTKQVRIDAGSITTGTTRVLTMPDRDVTPGDTASVTTGNIPQKSAAGAFADSPLSTDGDNVSLGAALANWSNSVDVFQLGNDTALVDGAASYLSKNAYFDGASWKYMINGYASQIAANYSTVGGLDFLVAGSGTADTAITWTTALTVDSSGNVLVKKTASNFAAPGLEVANSTGQMLVTRDDGVPFVIRRNTSDGNLLDFYQDATLEGNISVSGTTVSLVGGHLSRWSQWADGPHEPRIEVPRGTVLSNRDEMCVWLAAEYDDPESGARKRVLYDGPAQPGSIIDYTLEDGTVVPATVVQEANEQLNKVAVSSLAGDRDVAGVFQGYDEDDIYSPYDFYVAQSGDFVVRIGAGVTVTRGDLLESAGDGTARPQADDIVRAGTIAKVTSTHVSETYPDGSYLVPCVLLCGG